MSDKEDDIFADSDSDNTADLFAQTEETKKKTAAPQKITKKKKAAAPQKKQDDEGDDLFNSDSEDEGDSKPKELSKREKMAALARKRAGESSSSPNKDPDAPQKKKDKDTTAAASSSGAADAEQKDGYESGDSVDSAEIQRTADDDNFIDTTGEDEEAVKEYYAKQHFDEDLGDMEDRDTKKKRKYGADEAIEDNGEPDNPLAAAMLRLKKKKREKKSTLELEDEVKEFISRMETAAEQDEEAVAERRPGMKKLGMINEVVDIMKKQDYQSYLIEFDLLSAIRRWIQPLPNGQLGNVTVRTKLLDAVANMPGIHPNALKRSELGKTIMVLHKHPKETPSLKRQTRELIELWSRGIFQKSGDMRELEHVHHSRGEGSLAAIRRQQGAAASTANAAARRDKPGDLKGIISSGKRGGDTIAASVNRVRVPFSKGFSYSVRPTAKAAGETDARRSPAKDTRGGLNKRMLDRAKKAGKNQRSANISVEGRRTKG